MAAGEVQMLRLFRVKIALKILSICLFLVTASCIVQSPPPPPPKPEPPPPSGSLLKPQLRVAISPDYPPLAYKALGRVVGVEADLANQLGKELGKQMVFEEAPWPELINLLLQERADIIMSGMSITNERAIG